MDKSFLFFDGIGTLADWVGIIATLFAIWLTIRHFSKENRIKYEFILDVEERLVYDPEKGEHFQDGFLYVISVYNDSPTPIQVRADKFREKNTFIEKICKKNKQTYFIDIFDERTSNDFIKIEPFDKKQVRTISHKWILERSKNNNINLEKNGLEILFTEIRGVEKSFTFKRNNMVRLIL